MIPLGILAAAKRSGGAPATYAAFNPLDKSPNVSLSGANLIATGVGGSAGIVRANAALTGKRYFEMVFTDVLTGTATTGVGIANATHSLTASLGYANPNGWAFWGTNTGARHDGVTAIAAINAWSGTVLGFAFDADTGRLWIRRDGTWLSGDPAAGTGAIWSGIAGPVYPAACPWTDGADITARFNPSHFSHSAPAGFSPVTA